MYSEENAFVDVDVEEFQKTNFKQNVWLKNMIDLKPYQGKEFHITHGVPTRNNFMPPCMSWDRTTGYRRETKEKIECETCPYLKGIMMKDKEGKDMKVRCSQKYAIFMEHEDPEKQFVIMLNFTVQKKFAEYRKSLLKLGLDVNKVITKITLEMDEKAKPTYDFKFVSELDLNITEKEEEILNGIKANVKKDKDDMAVNDAADIIVDVFKVRGSPIDKMRARRLAESIANGDGVIEA